MQRLALRRFGMLALVGTCFLAACFGSTANPPVYGPDAATTGGGSSCSPAAGACTAGQTCCLTSATQEPGGGTAVSGTCVTGSCPTGFSYGCTSNAQCSGGDVCCASLTLPPGSDVMDFLPPAFDLQQATAGGKLDASGFGLNIQCQSSCAGPSLDASTTQIQLCQSDSDCPSGDKCYAPASSLGASIGGTMGCVPAAWVGDAGIDATVEPEAGAAEAAVDSTAVDGSAEPPDTGIQGAPESGLPDAPDTGTIPPDSGSPEAAAPVLGPASTCDSCVNNCFVAPTSSTTIGYSCGSSGPESIQTCVPSTGCPDGGSCIYAENNCNCSLRYNSAASGVTVCQPAPPPPPCLDGGDCSSEGCCAGLVCNNAASTPVCVSSSTCGASWDSDAAPGKCATSQDCCNSVCPPGGGYCGGPSNNCAVDAGAPCTQNSGCCNFACNTSTLPDAGYVCASNTCASFGGQCATNADCCNAVCGNGTCGGGCTTAKLGPAPTFSYSYYAVGSAFGGTIVPGTYILTYVGEMSESTSTSYTGTYSPVTLVLTSSTVSEVEPSGRTSTLAYTVGSPSSNSFAFGAALCAGSYPAGGSFLNAYGVDQYSATSSYTVDGSIPVLELYGMYDGQIPYEFQFTYTGP